MPLAIYTRLYLVTGSITFYPPMIERLLPSTGLAAQHRPSGFIRLNPFIYYPLGLSYIFNVMLCLGFMAGLAKDLAIIEFGPVISAEEVGVNMVEMELAIFKRHIAAA